MSESSDSAQQAQKTFQWRGIAQLVVVAVVAVVAIYFARAPGSDALVEEAPRLEARPPTVDVVRPVVTKAARTIRTTGVVAVSAGVGLRSQVTGEVVFVSPKLSSGGSFGAGETLVRIDRRDHGLRLEAAQARLRHAQARLLKQQLKGERKSERYRRENPAAEVPDLVARIPQIAREQALVDAAMNGIELAELHLSRTDVSLPFAGRVRTSEVQVGQVVGPTRRLAQVFPKDAIEVEARVSLEDLDALAPVIGRVAQVAAGGQIFDVAVQRVSSVIDLQSRLATLYMAFPADSDLASLPRPGTFANVMLEGPPMDGVFVLPEAAEQANGSVWIVDDGALAAFAPRSLGRIPAGWLVQAFDSSDGVVVGKVPAGREGLRVQPKPASS